MSPWRRRGLIFRPPFPGGGAVGAPFSQRTGPKAHPALRYARRECNDLADSYSMKGELTWSYYETGEGTLLTTVQHSLSYVVFRDLGHLSTLTTPADFLI